MATAITTTKTENDAIKQLLESVYGSVNNALTFTANVKSKAKDGTEKISRKKVTLSCDTVIGDFENGLLYSFEIKAYIGNGKPKSVLGLSLDYDGQISTFSNAYPIAANAYSVDNFQDNVTLNILAIDLLLRVHKLNDSVIGLFFDLLKLNGFEFSLTDNKLPILSKIKLDQVSILKLFVNRGKDASPNTPLKLIADQCKALLPTA